MWSYRRAPGAIWLDLDATDDPLHGHREGRFFHGSDGCSCYLPLSIFCGAPLLCARLRPSDREALAGRVEELARIVGQVRRHWPHTRIGIRGDSGFCREPILRWCEDNGVDSVLGLARNKRLVGAIGARAAHRRTGKAARRYRDFEDMRQKSWSRSRRVVGKAEDLTKGETPRFGVTRLPTRRAAAKRLSEKLSCARGDRETRIKEQQLDLFADRTSAQRMRANQLRLYVSSFAYVRMQPLRTRGAQGTELARAQGATLQRKLLKVGTRIGITARRVWLSFSQAYPYARVFAEGLASLQREPLWREPG